MEKIFESVVRQANMNKRVKAGDYVNEDDGLLYCGDCDTPKETIIEFDGQKMKVACLCKCGEEKRDFEEQKEKDQKRFDRINRLRQSGIADKSLQNYRFENAFMTKSVARCKRYVNKWDEMYQKNLGLILHGNTGNGKTFCAACIANELIDRGIPALVTSFPRILSLSSFEREDIFDRFNQFPLLVIDDLGVERQSDYALETVYLVIDERYKSGKPLIVTTNLKLEDLQNPPNMRYQRIYDRILEMCVPVFFEEESFRKQKYNEKVAKDV